MDQYAVQTPRVGNALRGALALDGAGSLPLQMEATILPVVIVADVTQTLALDPVVVHNTRSIAAVAAQYSRAAFEVQANTDLKECYLNRLQIVAGAAMEVWCGFLGTLLLPTTDALPQRTRYSLRAAITRGRMIGDTNVAAPALSTAAKVISLLANETFTLEFPSPIIIDTMIQGALYVVHASVVNVKLTVSAEWVEVPKVN